MNTIETHRIAINYSVFISKEIWLFLKKSSMFAINVSWMLLKYFCIFLLLFLLSRTDFLSFNQRWTQFNSKLYLFIVVSIEKNYLQWHCTILFNSKRLSDTMVEFDIVQNYRIQSFSCKYKIKTVSTYLYSFFFILDRCRIRNTERTDIAQMHIFYSMSGLRIYLLYFISVFFFFFHCTGTTALNVTEKIKTETKKVKNL